MDRRTWIARRSVLRSGAGLSIGGLLGACGAGGGVDALTTAVSSGTGTGAGSGSGSGAGSGSGSGSSSSGVLPSNLDASTFMIGYTIELQGRERTLLLGTGFAIEGNLIATNAHVTKGLLDEARALAANGIRIKRASAFQSETGKEYPLLKAVIHPSYTGGTRSPDAGLFEARDQLPARLQLDTAQGSTRLRKGDAVQQNGFPGDLFNAVFDDFQPGLSVPKATLYTGTIQTIENFDSRVVVDPANISLVDMYQHSMDTSGGTSGSPILSNGKVIGLHNAGLSYEVFVAAPNGQATIRRVPTATGSWGINVKHLINLVAFYKQGVLEADKSFTVPPPDALLAVAGGGQSTSGAIGGSYGGSVANPSNPNVAHQIRLSIDPALNVGGSTQWPANPALGLAARSFALRGKADANGRIEVVDNTPETITGFRRGVYIGFLNPASGRITGEYYELNESTQELIYFGDWAAAR